MANKVLRGAMKVVYNGNRYVIHPETEISEVEGYTDDVTGKIANNIVRRSSFQFSPDEIFAKGVITFEEDSGIVKFADGNTVYSNLPTAAGRAPNAGDVQGLSDFIYQAIVDTAINGNKITGTITKASIPSANVNGLSKVITDSITESTIAAAKVKGTLTGASIASSNVTGDLAAVKVKGTLTGASIASSNVTGDLVADKVKGTLSGASIESSKVLHLADAINSQINVCTLNGTQVVNTLSNAEVPAANVKGTLTAATIAVDHVTGDFAADRVKGTLTGASIASDHVTGDLAASKVKGTLASAYISADNVTGGTIRTDVEATAVKGSLINASIASSNVTGTIATSKLNGTLSAASISGSLTNATVPSDLKVLVKSTFSNVGYYGNGTLKDILEIITGRMVFKPLMMTSAEFQASDPYVYAGQFALETDTGVLKMGDGVNTYSGLKYYWTQNQAVVPTTTSVEHMNFEGMSVVNSAGTTTGTVQDTSKVTQARIEFENDGGTVIANKLNVGSIDSHEGNVFFEVSEGL